MKEEAAACMAQYGIRRTTVDEIVNRVTIPKGTSYLFYKSKELLLFEVIQEQHETVNRELFKAISEIAHTDFSAEKLTDLIFDFYKMTENMPILKLLDANEADLLRCKLPRELLRNICRTIQIRLRKCLLFFP